MRKCFVEILIEKKMILTEFFFVIVLGYSYIAEEIDPDRYNVHYVDDSTDENLNSLCWDIFSNREKVIFCFVSFLAAIICELRLIFMNRRY